MSQKDVAVLGGKKCLPRQHTKTSKTRSSSGETVSQRNPEPGNTHPFSLPHAALVVTEQQSHSDRDYYHLLHDPTPETDIMLDRIQSKLHRARSETKNTSPPPFEKIEKATNTNEPHPSNDNNNDDDDPITESPPPPLTRTNSNTSIQTTSTLLPSYANATQTESPPSYNKLCSSTIKPNPNPKHRLSIQYQHLIDEPSSPRRASSASTYSPRATGSYYQTPPQSSYATNLSPWSSNVMRQVGVNTESGRHHYDLKRQKQRNPKREIPLDHPVHDMPSDEQVSLRRRGLDPVVVAEGRARMRVLR